ncbi:hypothetical protein CRG98_039062 [Punica granatum]|uniref:Aminotransferase-like plant mobile domain-containing protein n=1 Tax=Punica granatum TaxID=22663 RepID=A0A2I0I980_PUNGR|nr:hypothetical protein CRG98_039062 [Punica granatum]
MQASMRAYSGPYNLATPLRTSFKGFGLDPACLHNTLCPIEKAYIREILGELPELAECSIDWTLLRAAIEFWDPQHAMFNFQGTELTPTIKEYTALIERLTGTQDIVVPNLFAMISSRLSVFLGIRIEEAQQELLHGWEHNIQINWLINWTHLVDSNRRGTCPRRPSSEKCHSYAEALMAETVRSLDYVQANRRYTMMGSLHHLQMWLLGHIQPFCLYHPFLNLVDDQLFQAFGSPEPNAFDWRRFILQLTPEQLLWCASWNLGGPMAIGCPVITGLPLISHSGSTLVFPNRVIRQLGGVQDVPVEGNRALGPGGTGQPFTDHPRLRL